MCRHLLRSCLALFWLFSFSFAYAAPAAGEPWLTFYGKASGAAYRFQETAPQQGVLTIAGAKMLYWLYLFRDPATGSPKIAQFHVCAFDPKRGQCLGPWQWVTPRLAAGSGSPQEFREAQERLREARRYVDAALKDVERQKKQASKKRKAPGG